MSTATAPSRTTRPSRTTGRAAAPVRRPTPRPPVRAVESPSVAPARAPFVALVLVVLSLGLGALLLLNTLLAQGSFTLHALEGKVADLADREQELQQRAAELASPQRLARSAAALGMVPSENPAFLRAEDGKVLGEPVPAADPPPVVGSVDPAESMDSTETSGSEQGQQESNGQVDSEKQSQQESDSQTNSQTNSQADSEKQGNQTTQGDGGSDR